MRQYVETGLVALDLANTWDEYLDDPELLPDLAALHRFCAELDEAPGDDLEAVREVRERLRTVLSGEQGELARWVAELPVRVTVQETEGGPRLRLEAADGTGLAGRLGVRAVRELLDLAAAGDWVRLRQCAATPCRDAFVDRSRPGLRQFCSTRCANRAHAAASRARHRA